MFVGWEGVGLASYFLISFWKPEMKQQKVGLKQYSKQNRRCILYVCIALMWTIFKSFDFGVFLTEVLLLSKKRLITFFWLLYIFIKFAQYLFVIAACAKSAQLLLHTWLQMPWKDLHQFPHYSLRNNGYCWCFFDNSIFFIFSYEPKLSLILHVQVY